MTDLISDFFERHEFVMVVDVGSSWQITFKLHDFRYEGRSASGLLEGSLQRTDSRDFRGASAYFSAFSVSANVHIKNKSPRSSTYPSNYLVRATSSGMNLLPPQDVEK